MRVMDLHKVIKDYEINDKLYNQDGYDNLVRFLLDYANAHSWFHWHGRLIEDTNPKYLHLAVVYWNDGARPTLNTFSFKRSITEEKNDDDIE